MRSDVLAAVEEAHRVARNACAFDVEQALFKLLADAKKPAVPLYESDALTWVDQVTTRLNDRIMQTAFERAKADGAATVTADRMRLAAFEVLGTITW